MTQPTDPLELIAALTKRVEDLEKLVPKVAKKLDKGAAKIEQHVLDHAASGYDFRKAQTDSRNETPPAPENNYPTQ